MKTNRTLIDDFIAKQGLSEEDTNVQLDCIREELAELIFAGMVETEHRELEEAIDVLVTVFVYLRMIGFSWNAIDEEFEKKMLINVDKPVREEKGVKVKKNEE